MEMRKMFAIAGLLILVGIIIVIVTLGTHKWSFVSSSGETVTAEYEFDGKIEDININVGTTNVVFEKSDNNKCKVVSVEREEEKHIVTEEDGTLSIIYKDYRKWYQTVGISFGPSLKVTVYLPEKEYRNLDVHASTGNVKIPGDFEFKEANIGVSTGNVYYEASAKGIVNLSASTGNVFVKDIKASEMSVTTSTGRIEATGVELSKDLYLKVSTGRTELNDVKCADFKSEGSTGKFEAEKLIASGNLNIKRSTGNVRLENSDAFAAYIVTDTGDVSGSFLTEKVFITSSDTGRISVPKTITGGRCEITTDTGNITFK